MTFQRFWVKEPHDSGIILAKKCYTTSSTSKKAAREERRKETLIIFIDTFYDRDSPFFSEASHLRSSIFIPHRKTDFEQTESAIR